MLFLDWPEEKGQMHYQESLTGLAQGVGHGGPLEASEDGCDTFLIETAYCEQNERNL